MTFDEILSEVRKIAAESDASNVNFFAIQVNLTDCDPGVFYVEVKDHKVSVEPYEYNDRSCAITMKSDDFHKMINGKLDPVLAFTIGKLKLDGDVGKALEFSKLFS